MLSAMWWPFPEESAGHFGAPPFSVDGLLDYRLNRRRMLRPSGRDGDGVTYQFDAFTLDVGTRRLMRDHEEVHLSPKAFDLLLLLVENRSQALAKGELHRRLWPSTYVTETNLAGLIVELRRALADSADQPQYIRTMHRFGYWFV